MNTNTTYRSIFATLTVGAALLIGTTKAATAQYDFIPNNATINNAVPSGEEVIVGYAGVNPQGYGTNPSSPTVNVIAPAVVGNGLEAFNSSIVNISGGTFGDETPNTVEGCGTSTINITGGSITCGVATRNGDNATINVSGGSIIASNSWYGPALSVPSGTVNVSGGIIGNFYNGVKVAGGTMNLSGGVIGNYNITVDSGTLNVYGSQPIVSVVYKRLPDGVLVPTYHFTPGRYTVTATKGTTSGGFTEWTLGGNLSDGTNVSGVQVWVASGATFNVYW